MTAYKTKDDAKLAAKMHRKYHVQPGRKTATQYVFVELPERRVLR